MAVTGMQENTTRQPVQRAIQSNIVIQNELAAQAAQLEAQLKQLDELVEAVNRAVVTEEVPDEAFEGELRIPGSKRVNSPIASFELLSQSSPFYREASQRAHYVRWTTAHPIKTEVLADAVKKENMRLEAYRARNDPTVPPIDIETNVEGINWSIVAEKVTNGSPIRRTPDECRIQWVGNLHPKINHGDWTQDEENKLHGLTASALANGEKINWTRIAQELGTNRIPLECMKRATTRPRHHWDAAADQKLREAVQKFGTNNWNIVARHVSPYATTSQCQTRYFRSVDPSIKREPWTSEEDSRLRKAVEVYENSWVDVAGVLPGRTNEQCRERWTEIGINEGGKGAWSAEEDQKLWDAAKELGKKWKEISKRVGGGRTGPNCRLRHGRLVRMRAGQAEVTLAPGPGPSQAPPQGASTAPTETSASTSRLASESPTPAPISVPIPALPKTKVRPRRKPKAPPVSIENDGTREDGPEPSTILEPPEAPIQRPRPRPRPVYKSKGKDRAHAGDIAENPRIGSEQQSFNLSVPQTAHTSVGGGSGSQPELVRGSGVGGAVINPYQFHSDSMDLSSLQLGEEPFMSGSVEGLGPGPPVHEPDQEQREPKISRGGKRKWSEGQGNEDGETGHTERDQNTNREVEAGEQLQSHLQQETTRKRQKTSAVVGDESPALAQDLETTDADVIAIDEERDAGPSEIAFSVSARGRSRGRAGAHGRGRGRGRGGGPAGVIAAIRGDGESGAQEGAGGSVPFDADMRQDDSVVAGDVQVPQGHNKANEHTTDSMSLSSLSFSGESENVGSGMNGRGRGGGRGRGRGRGRGEGDAQSPRRSGRVASSTAKP